MRWHLTTIVFFVFSTSLFSQSRGTITGTVSDPTGDAVANASVEAKNVDSGAMYPVASSATGNYTIGELPEGNYELTVAAPGFKKYVRGGLTVQVAQTVRIDVVLQVGSTSESVTVTAESPLLKTESGEMSQNIATERMDNLPLLPTGAAAGNSGIRNPYAVIALLPGSYYAGTGTAANNSTVQINGAPVNTETILVEGMDATNPIGQGLVQFNQPGTDAVQEWSVQTSNYNAEFGQSGGGIMNVTMKSGTNQFHGTGYEYFVNEDLNAGQPFTNNGTGHLIRPETRRNDFGGTLGGPVWIPKVYNGRNKTFFFFSFEQYRLGQNVIPTAISVPTAAYRQGDFSSALLKTQLGSDPLGRPIFGNEVYDPTTARTVGGQTVTDPFPNNTIPQSRFDPVAVAIQNLLPAPTNGLLANNYQNSFRSTTTTTVPSIKIDQTLDSKDKLSFYWSKIRNLEPIAVGANGLPEPLSTDVGTDIRANTTRLSFDRIVSPTLLLHLGAGFMQDNLGQPLEGTFNPAQIGLVGPFSQPSGFPVISGTANAQGGLGNATVGTTAGAALGPGAHAYQIQEQPTAIASLTWVKNNHTFKFGGSMLIQGDINQSLSTLNGTYTFSSLQTALPYVALTSSTGTVGGNTIGFPYASFLLGLVANGNVHEPSDVRLGRSQWAGYVQDTWKVTRTFTLDYGLRYDYSTYLKEQYGRAPNLSATLANPTVGGIPGAAIYEATCKCNFANNYPWAFGPRLGAAYQITPKTVVRAGFAIAYSGTPLYGNGGGAGTASNPFGPNANPYQPAMVLSQGVPLTAQQIAWPNLNPGQFPLVGAGSALVGAGPPSVIDQNAGRPARNYQWSLGVQREIMPNLVVEAAYVGTRGIWWATSGPTSSTSQLVNYNYLTPQILSANGLSLSNPVDLAILSAQIGSPAAGSFQNKVPYAGFPLTATVAQSLRPFPQFNSGLTATWAPLGDTWYDSLQLKATKRLSHGLDATFAFTWAKNLDNMEGATMPTNVGNRQTAVTLNNLDRPLVSSWAINYTVPSIFAGSGSTGLKAVSWVARDWRIGGFFQYSSGSLIPPPLATSSPSLSNLDFQNTVMDRVPGVPLYLQNLNCHCFDPSTTFVLNPAAWVNPLPGQFGTATYYDDYRYQRRPVENLALGRVFPIHEKANLNIRIEFTNIFNRTEVNNPSSSNPLQAQTRVNSNPNSQTTAGFGYVNTLGTTFATPRQGQIVARFTF
ncbi:MAG TPA: TonB-dependent receptor [Bryobacteraceae bacterium]|nr:TonB-dependent receptor [Bryobacteraceae bacterium]